MILIKKMILFIFFILSVLFLLFLGISYYKIFMFLIYNQDHLLIKYHAENFIYFSIVAVLILLTIFIILLIKSRNIYKELDKVIEISKNSNIEIDEFLKRLGNFGNKVNELTKNITKISHLKTLKISTYWNLLNFFIDNYSSEILLIAHDGFIINISSDMFLNLGIEKKEIIKKNLTEIFEDFNFKEIINKLNTSKLPITIKNKILTYEKKRDKFNLTFYPFFDQENNLTFIIASKREKDTRIIEEMLSKQEEVTGNKKFKILNFVGGIKKNIKKINIFKQKK